MIGRTIIVLASLLAMSPAVKADTGDFAHAMVEMHNAERAEVGSRPLQWDDRLAASAASYARTLAQTNRFEHDPRNEREGENLWMGTRSRYAFDEMIGMWAEEKRILPKLRRWHDDVHSVGHYTQMVWKDTTRVGCAIASNPHYDYLVCRYGPQGNFIGRSPYVSGGMSMP